MEKRWQVYHRGELLGLMTAKEIRDALRQGTLDPFDKVSLEDSSIREELIDVDEIFNEETEELTQIANIAVTEIAGSDRDTAPVREFSDPDSFEESPPRNRPRNIPQQREPKGKEPRSQPASTGQDISRIAAKPPNSTKVYYVIDDKKILGPLSVLEIQSLFNRGLLNRKVKVQKSQGNRQIPIAQFMERYSGDRLKALTDDGKYPQLLATGNPSSKVLNELSRVANSRRLAQKKNKSNILLMVMIGLVTGVFIFFAFDGLKVFGPGAHQTDRDEENLSKTGALRGGPSALKPRARPTPKLVQKQQQQTPSAPPRSVIVPPPIPLPRVAEPKSVEPNPLAFAKIDTNGKQRKVAVTKRSNRALVAQAPASRKTESPSRGNDTQQRRTPPPNVEVAAGGPIANAKSQAGRTQTVGPLFFNANALDACGAKCTLVLRDGTGSTLRTIFFKAAYYDQLKAKSGGVTLTGQTRLEDGDLVLIIQDIR